MSRELKVIMNDDGVFKEYDDTYDITIHMESEEEQDKILEWLNKMLEAEDKVYASPCDLCLYGDRDDKYVHCVGCNAARK